MVAEGAGQSLLAESPKSTNASGNAKLGDIGLFLKYRINFHFASQCVELNLKYIDPSYLIRSVPANPFDSVYSLRLTHNAVHAAMCGRTEMVVGRWHGRFVHVPIPLAIRERNQVDPSGDLWMSVLESTGQPPSFVEVSRQSSWFFWSRSAPTTQSEQWATDNACAPRPKTTAAVSSVGSVTQPR